MRCNLATVIWMHFPPDTMFWVAESLLLVLITSTHTPLQTYVLCLNASLSCFYTAVCVSEHQYPRWILFLIITFIITIFQSQFKSRLFGLHIFFAFFRK